MSHNVLIVDDDLVNRKLARALLEHLGWQVTECENGQQALEQAATGSFATVLLDIGLPDLSGWEVCQQLRARHGNALRIIAYTAHMLEEDTAQMLQSGFDQVLIKPVTLASVSRFFAAPVQNG